MKSPNLDKAVELPVIENNYDLTIDPLGYFLIRLNNQKIEVGFCNNDHQMLYKWTSKSAKDLSKAIVDKQPNISTSHAIYIGRELQQAEHALQNNQVYIQD
ncbi:MAG: hypothetical protein A2Y40_03250 [Candidatus Margulisbacteria bacterium GWF2_35_9]|nr:MAG: hypothetical protein A2Y40_03250 [Candidatus Margulisbacteria bacterium GWF2_35_9]